MRWTIVIVACAGCYSPSYRDCEVSCASGAGCPSGFTCDEGQQVCRAAGMTGACSATGNDGGGGDGPGSDANACWHGVEPSNFAPCDVAFPPAIGSFTFLNGEVFNTDTGMLDASSAPAPGARYSYAGHDMWLIHFASWSLGPGITLNTVGELPLLIVSDADVAIDGTLNLLPGASRAGCGALGGGSSAFSGAGGAGGGHGAAGGDGGANGDGDVPGTNGGGARGDATLVPLSLGCEGGGGGTGGGMTHGGRVGLGGGSTEIASQTKIQITGKILAVGGGGGGGTASASGTSGCTGNVACAGGGGGGGAGGAILVEAPVVDEPMTGSICAGGGGGGEGGDSAMVGSPRDGADGGCTGGGAGASTRAGGDGGNGSIAGAAQAGGPGAVPMPPTGGGGGGGGPGRIRIHATTPSINGTVSPVATP